MLVDRSSIGVGVNVNFIPSNLLEGVLMANVTKFVDWDFSADLEIGIQRKDFAKWLTEEHHENQYKTYHLSE